MISEICKGTKWCGVQPPLITPPPSLVYITKERLGFQEAALENEFRERSERNWFRE
jgi:hypothetical protein